ncbi:UNVERIFIED_CONTAM: hypothetical protein HHA_269425 [Hammondia hammondi]|eukprot:XP_008882336.1 hypothetical protein HHA_269425 [Hammondia hammondi]
MFHHPQVGPTSEKLTAPVNATVYLNAIDGRSAASRNIAGSEKLRLSRLRNALSREQRAFPFDQIREARDECR